MPDGWTIEGLNATIAEPGSCSQVIFRTPSVYLDHNGFRPLCVTSETRLASPVDGLWIAAPAPNGAGTQTETFAFDALPVALSYSYADSEAVVAVHVSLGPRTIEVVIGLGNDPTVAEAIISSIQATNLPPSVPTPTTSAPADATTRVGHAPP